MKFTYLKKSNLLEKRKGFGLTDIRPNWSLFHLHLLIMFNTREALVKLLHQWTRYSLMLPPGSVMCARPQQSCLTVYQSELWFNSWSSGSKAHFTKSTTYRLSVDVDMSRCISSSLKRIVLVTTDNVTVFLPGRSTRVTERLSVWTEPVTSYFL